MDQQPTEQKLYGTIKHLADKGYGWIRAQDGRDYFFHNTELIDVTFSLLKCGDQVKFLPVASSKGPRANEVERTRIQPIHD